LEDIYADRLCLSNLFSLPHSMQSVIRIGIR
jgi:hypothetical protein